jgi:hypothetical protein
MKKLVWIAGALLLFSFVFPNGLTLPKPPAPAPAPAPAPVVPVADTDPAIVAALTNATAEDKARIVSVYSGAVHVLSRDAGKRVSNTEKWADMHANTLQLAIDTPGKYPGLDAAIEGVFARAIGTDDVVIVDAEMQKKLLRACEVVIASAR